MYHFSGCANITNCSPRVCHFMEDTQIIKLLIIRILHTCRRSLVVRSWTRPGYVSNIAITDIDDWRFFARPSLLSTEDSPLRGLGSLGLAFSCLKTKKMMMMVGPLSAGTASCDWTRLSLPHLTFACGRLTSCCWLLHSAGPAGYSLGD